MAHFYGSMAGSAKTEATRCGTKNSGISAHVRGWHSGVMAFGMHDSVSGNDHFEVRMSKGSSDMSSITLGHVRENPDGTVSFLPSAALIEAVKTADRGELRF
jgi:hypothetical protein